MAIPNPPYFVSFSADAASSAKIDHSQLLAGGSGAGHTAINFEGKGALTVQPEIGATRPDGRAPFYFRSINVYFRLTDYLIQITSDYPEGSCRYDATMRHEVSEHILKPIGIMNSFRDQVVTALNAIRAPSQNNPDWIRPADMDATRSGYVDQVKNVVRLYRFRISAALQQAKTDSDSPESYRAVYQQCTIDEWRR
jgi:hypothetical protein